MEEVYQQNKGLQGKAREPSKALCRAVWAPVRSQLLPGILDGFGPILRLCGGRKNRRKPWRFYGAQAVTSARSAGGFRGHGLTLSGTPKLRLTLFPEKQTNIPAIAGHSLTLSRIWEVFDNG